MLKINSPAFRRKGAGGKRRRRAARRHANKNSESRKTPFECWKLAESGSAKRYLRRRRRARDPKIVQKVSHRAAGNGRQAYLWNWMKPPLTKRFRHVGTEHEMTMIRPPNAICRNSGQIRRLVVGITHTHSRATEPYFRAFSAACLLLSFLFSRPRPLRSPPLPYDGSFPLAFFSPVLPPQPAKLNRHQPKSTATGA